MNLQLSEHSTYRDSSLKRTRGLALARSLSDWLRSVPLDWSCPDSNWDEALEAINATPIIGKNLWSKTHQELFDRIEPPNHDSPGATLLRDLHSFMFAFNRPEWLANTANSLTSNHLLPATIVHIPESVLYYKTAMTIRRLRIGLSYVIHINTQFLVNELLGEIEFGPMDPETINIGHQRERDCTPEQWGPFHLRMAIEAALRQGGISQERITQFFNDTHLINDSGREDAEPTVATFGGGWAKLIVETFGLEQAFGVWRSLDMECSQGNLYQVMRGDKEEQEWYQAVINTLDDICKARWRELDPRCEGISLRQQYDIKAYIKERGPLAAPAPAAPVLIVPSATVAAQPELVTEAVSLGTAPITTQAINETQKKRAKKSQTFTRIAWAVVYWWELHKTNYEPQFFTKEAYKDLIKYLKAWSKQQAKHGIQPFVNPEGRIAGKDYPQHGQAQNYIKASSTKYPKPDDWRLYYPTT